MLCSILQQFAWREMAPVSHKLIFAREVIYNCFQLTPNVLPKIIPCYRVKLYLIKPRCPKML